MKNFLLKVVKNRKVQAAALALAAAAAAALGLDLSALGL